MNVILNGELRELRAQARVRDALVATGAPDEGHGIAVAVEGEVIPRPQWDELELHEGQRVEVVQAVQGG